jgi:hypothetical protein
MVVADMTAQQLELIPVERCDYCGPLEWTKDRFGQVTHKHSCPHRQEAFCQAHPTDCSSYEPKPMTNPDWPLKVLPGETWEDIFK